MEFEINQVPFKMSEITEQLFDKQFLSDVTFIVEGMEIYAHSLELMKRSDVFEQQLKSTVGQTNQFTITSYTYNTFYQFLHFIYTDRCQITDENIFDLLELANMYNVVRLINVLLNYSENLIKKLDFCVANDYQIGLNSTRLEVAADLHEVLLSEEFLSIHPETVEEILQLDPIGRNVDEEIIVDALVRWMDHYSSQHQIKFSECCQQFNNLIRLIRFPTISTEKLRALKTEHPDLLTHSDYLNIGGQKIFGTDHDDGIWNCRPRMEFTWPYEFVKLSSDTQFETKFNVSSHLILSGMVIGGSSDYINISITCQLDGYDIWYTNINEVAVSINSVAISMGSIRICPQYTYVIGFKIIDESDEKLYYLSRKPETELIIEAPTNSVTVLESHPTMHEILFLNAEEETSDVEIQKTV